MVELLATIVIVVSSTGLFFYWFRYTCLLILSAKTSHNYAIEIAAAHSLGFVTVNAQLSSASEIDLDVLRESLDRDYAVIKRLLERTEVARVENGIESGMLALNYRLSRIWYQVSAPFSSSISRQALQQMTATIEYFANSFGELAANTPAA